MGNVLWMIGIGELLWMKYKFTPAKFYTGRQAIRY